MTRRLPSCVYIFFLLLPFTVIAQKSLVHHTFYRDYREAVALFESKKYVPAQHIFSRILLACNHDGSILEANASFYHAMCAVRLFNNDAEYLVAKFIEEHPGNSHIKEAYFEMARVHYNNERFRHALLWLSKLDKYDLKGDERAEYFFTTGHSWFMLDSFARARVALFEILDKKSKYQSPAIYYYGHIAYEQQNYQTALNNFEKLRNDKLFGSIVPYYIIQIHYMQKKYKHIINYGHEMLEKVIEKRKGEIARIIGEAFYSQGLYDSSLHYFIIFKQYHTSFSAQDYYRLGYAFYRAAKYDSAITYFGSVSNDSTLIAQNALYHLGDCFLKTGEKNKAKMAFSAASSLPYDSVIQREALFTYAVLTYELSTSPFNDAIITLNTYIDRYPASEKADLAFKYLMMAYMYTRNYKDALSSIEKIKNKTEDIKEAYQRIAYFRGLELYSNMEMESALQMFNKSLIHASYNHILKAEAHYWRAETFYRLGQYQRAVDDYTMFQQSLGSYNFPEYNNSYYAMGYAYFNLKNYKEASVWFRKYIELSGDKPHDKQADACNRSGDCFFMAQNYRQAIEYYDKAARMNGLDADYALFQKAFAFGLLGNIEEKIRILSQLYKNYPHSAYLDDALYEMGNSFLYLDLGDSAILCYTRIINDFPSSSYVSKALVQLGLVYYNMEKNEEALSYYQRVITEYKGSEEERSALLGLKNVYVAMNRVDEYFTFAKTVQKHENISESSRDSLQFSAARSMYMKGDYKGAKNLFANYLISYPNGFFVLDARFYKGECHNKDNELSQALEEYAYIIQQPLNIFSEEALLAAGRIYAKQNEYEKALETYKKLEVIAEVKVNKREARIQQIYAAYALKKYNIAIDIANNLLIEEKLPEELRREIRLILAKSQWEIKETALAIDNFTALAREVKSKEGAEAKYILIDHAFTNKQYDEVKREVFSFIDMNTPHRYWLAKAFIRLADTYSAENDDFQAIHTLRSVLENYEISDDGILDDAKEKVRIYTEKQKQTTTAK